MRVALQALAASFIAFGLTLFTPPVLAAEYNVGDPCPAGFPDGMKHQKDDGSGNGITLVCDGGTFVLNTEITGTKTLLQINNDPNACTAAKEGRLRYDPGGDTWAYCDSSGNWTPLFGSICTDDASGECLLSATRSNGDPEFTATNIADGVNILGVTGTLTVPANCSDDGTGECVLDATRSNSDPEFTASNIADGVNILGVTGSLGNSTAYLEGLVGHWPFDDGPGSTTVADISGFGNDGVLTNMDPSTDWVSGQIGGALEFDGNNDIVLIDDNNIFDMTYSLTISAWIYPTANGSPDGTILMKGDNPASYVLFHETLSGNWFGYFEGKNIKTGGPPNTGWTHLVMTYDGLEVNLYRNGVVVHTESYTDPIQVTSDPLQIGRNLRWGDPYTGRIDDVRLYNRALSASEVNTLYNNGL